MTLANIDPRLLAALRAIRAGTFSYKRGVSIPPDLLSSFSKDLGYPAAWGDPAQLPAYGGPDANRIWKTLNVTNRHHLGGIPCELVHGSVTGGSCTANAGIRGIQAFAEAVALYLPVGHSHIPRYAPCAYKACRRFTSYPSFSLDLANSSRSPD